MEVVFSTQPTNTGYWLTSLFAEGASKKSDDAGAPLQRYSGRISEDSLLFPSVTL